VSHKKKPLTKAVENNIREVQVKEREEKQAKKVADAQGVVMRTTQKTTNKIAKAKFVTA
jgi:hypothetical protein